MQNILSVNDNQLIIEMTAMKIIPFSVADIHYFGLSLLVVSFGSIKHHNFDMIREQFQKI